MTADHPTIETIADYRAGLLQPQHHALVSAHLSGCADCTAASNAVEEVSTLLAEASTDPVPMPEAVAARLDAVLRQAGADRADTHGADTVVPLERRATAAALQPTRRRAWPLLAAAAAALIVVGTVVIDDLDLSPGGSAESSVAGKAAAEDAASDGDAGATAGGGSAESDGPKKAAPGQHRLQPLSPRRLPGYAENLSRSQAPESASLVADRCSKVSVPAGDVASVARWEGSPAVIVVDPEARTATVFDCATGSVVLFRTKY